jgi:hypothetical protein
MGGSILRKQQHWHLQEKVLSANHNARGLQASKHSNQVVLLRMEGSAAKS